MSTQSGETSDYFFYQIANQLMNGIRNNEMTSLALAGASTALLSGSLYYYLNNNNTKQIRNNSALDFIDHRNQSREVKVKSYFMIIQGLK